MTQIEVVRSIQKDAKRMQVIIEADQIFLQGQVCPRKKTDEVPFYHASRRNLNEARASLARAEKDLGKLIKMMEAGEK